MLRLPFSTYIGPKQVIASPDSLGIIAVLPATRIAVICSKRVSNSDKLVSLLDKHKRASIKVFNPSWKMEPSLSEIKPTLSKVVSFRPDYIVAIGGGSILDGAKIIRALYEHPNFPLERLNIPFSLPPMGVKCKFCAIPTTAGTGSEASSTAVISDHDTGKKIPIISHDFLPDLVVLDPNLLVTLSPNLFFISAMDALSHTLEGHVSTLKNHIADGLVLQATKDIIHSLEQFDNININNTSLFEASLRGAFFAGVIQNLKAVGPAHAIAHQLGNSGVPHGLITGSLLPHVMNFNMQDESVRNKYNTISTMLGLKNPEYLIKHIAEFQYKFNMPTSLSMWETSVEQDIEVGKLANQDTLARYFPVKMSDDDLNSLFKVVW
jgi:acetaldehyde dehydrogenase/alcohol dehydrogenase